MKGLVGVISLGCDKNRVDSEIMLSKLVEGGYTLTNDCKVADVIIVNTCAFLEEARKEAIDTIIEMSAMKDVGNCKCIVVTGCLGQKYGHQVYKHLTEADIIVGINQYDDIVNIIDNQLATHNRSIATCDSVAVLEGNRILTTLPHTAYIKVADGCDNYCSYCLIPYIRGRFRSRTIQSIVDEAKGLVEGGVKEIILVAQDVTKYGTDIYGSSQLVALIQSLSAIEGLCWIRLLYCYPELVTNQLIEEIVNNDKVVNYIDIPLQHVDDAILTKMNRRSRNAEIVALFDKLKAHNIEIRSTFICGFPHETAQTNDAVKDFLIKYKLRNVGFFPYSREEGTAAYNLDKQLRKNQKEKMIKQLYAVQKSISATNNAMEVGKTLKCIVDSFVEKEQQYIYSGRCYYMSPDIDGCVFIHSDTELTIGQFVDVVITNSLEYDLIGEVK